MQRAVIVLRAKQVNFEVTYINLREKPQWFLDVSPHGKVPVLMVDDDVLFESNAIAEFLDETTQPRLHPGDVVKRARNRAWTDFVPDFSKALNVVTYASSSEQLEQAIAAAQRPLGRIEEALRVERGDDAGPYFNGARLSLVDASYAPFFMRFLLAESKLATGLLTSFPRVAAWAHTLASDASVAGSVADEFGEAFETNLRRRSALAAVA